ERSPGPGTARALVEVEAPEQRRAVHDDVARARGAEDIGLVDLERPALVSTLEFEERQVPGEMAVKRRAPVIAREPVLEERRATVVVRRLEIHVRDVVAGVGVAGILRERALRQPPGVVEASDLVIGECQGGLEPPVVAIRGGQALDESSPPLLAI